MPDLAVLLAQVAVVLAAARLLGSAARRVGQPRVVGEMAAGILLGPSLLGWAAPGVFRWLVPPGSLGYLAALSQVGLLVFMFVVGLHLDPRLLRGRGRAAVFISHASIALPFGLGALLAAYLYPRLAPAGVRFAAFALFMGAAMSVTAFPVVARILAERGMVQTRVGVLTLACAAVDDVTAWCILAAVVALVRAASAALPLWATLAGSAGFMLAMVFAVRPLLAPLEARFGREGQLSHDTLGWMLLVLLAAAWTTERLGIHALFGAFVAGAVFPHGAAFVRGVTDKLEAFAVVLLLPLFFALTGLRTNVAGLEGARAWGVCGVIVLVAVAGKFGGSAAAARLAGMSWRDAGALGALMNTRGLMELVILNVGLESGVISTPLFTMMVIMALATTIGTSVVLDRLYPAPADSGTAPSSAPARP